MQEIFKSSVKCLEVHGIPDIVLCHSGEAFFIFTFYSWYIYNNSLLISIGARYIYIYIYIYTYMYIYIYRSLCALHNVLGLLICITHFPCKSNICCCEVHPLPAVLGVKSIGYKSPPTSHERGASTVKNIAQRHPTFHTKLVIFKVPWKWNNVYGIWSIIIMYT